MAELIIGVAISLIVLGGTFAVVQVALHRHDAVAKRVAANQRGRPVMQRIVNDLHSACVAPGVAPVQAGSSNSTVRFISRSGMAVAPTPDLHQLTLDGSTLSESIYPATGGSQPTWTFSQNPSSTRELLTGVGPGAVGDPATSAPIFQYFAYTGGQVSTTPLPTPLSTADAARTVQVNVTFAVSPSSAPPVDPKAPITLSDSAMLRPEPASEDTAEVNLPCA